LSLSPHTELLPYNAAFVQPRSSHDDADTAAETNAAVGWGTGESAVAGAGVGATTGRDDGSATGGPATTSAQHRAWCMLEGASHAGGSVPRLTASEYPPPHAELLQHKSLSMPQPVDRVSLFSSSSSVHSRAPALSQKLTAACQVNSRLQPPRLLSLSPHTELLPYNAAFVQPRSSHDDADTAAGTNAAVGWGTGESAVAGAGVGATTGRTDGSATGGPATTSAQHRVGCALDDASHVGDSDPKLAASEYPPAHAELLQLTT